MRWLRSHAINPSLAKVAGVCGTLGGKITFLYTAPDGKKFYRERLANGDMHQPFEQSLCLYWPVGGRNAKKVLICEGEGDTLAAASVMWDGSGEPRADLPEPLTGLFPVGLPGLGAWRKGLKELGDVETAYVCLDADADRWNDQKQKMVRGPGPETADKLCGELARMGITTHRVNLPEGLDLADLLVTSSKLDVFSDVSESDDEESNWQPNGTVDERRAALTNLLAHAVQVKAKLEIRPPKPSRQIDTYDDLREIDPATWIEVLTDQTPDRAGFIHCPLPGHDDNNPSFKVFPDASKGVWCFSCQRGGDIYNFAQEYWGVDFLEAKRRLAEIFRNEAPHAVKQVELQEAKARLKQGAA